MHSGRCQKVNDRRCREGGTYLRGRKKYGEGAKSGAELKVPGGLCRRCQEGDAWWQVPGDGCGVEGDRRCRIEDAWREVLGAGFLGRFRERGAKRKVPEAAG